MSYDIYRIFVNGALEPKDNDIYITSPGSNCVPSRHGRWGEGNDAVYLYCDAIILSVRRLGKVYNILFWKKETDDGEETWDTSLFSPVPACFRWRTGAYPIYFPQVIKPEAVRHAGLEFIQKLVWGHKEALSKDDIKECFYKCSDVPDV